MLRASAKTDARKLAKALYRAMKENGGTAEVRAIGPGAVNQAVKAIAIARGFAAPEDGNVKFVPSFAKIQEKNKSLVAVRFTCYWY